jgi:hypothetical protein
MIENYKTLNRTDRRPKTLYFGRVESRDDPEKRGRVKVRILNIHSFRGNLVPIDSLPWAEPIMSISGPGPSVHPPSIFNWVFVEFLDGDINYPFYFGQANAEIERLTSRNAELYSINSDRDIFSRHSEEDRKKLLKEIKEGPKDWIEEEGGTTEFNLATSPYARADIDDSPIQRSNDNKTHVCNVSLGIRMRIIQGSAGVRAAIEWFRKGLKSLMSSFRKSAFGQWLESGIKHINSLLKKIRRFLKFVNDSLLELAKLIRDLQTLIAWILSLPARLLAFLKNCIDQFLSDISSALSEGWGSVKNADGTETSFSAITETIRETVGIVEEAGKIVSTSQELEQQFKTIPETFAKV